MRWALARCSFRLRTADHSLQSLASLERTRNLAQIAGGLGGARDGRGFGISRQHIRKGSTLRTGRKRGAQAQAIGVSRGGQTTKIHAVCDLLGRPVALALTPGNRSDVRAAEALIDATRRFKKLVADRGYDFDRFRRSLRQGGTKPVIPGRIHRKRKIKHDKRRYRDRWRIEAAFCRLKDFRRIATRYDKLATNFLSTFALAAVVAFWT